MFAIFSREKQHSIAILARPDISFALMWALVFLLYSGRLVAYFPPLHLKIVALVTGSFLIAFAASLLWSKLGLGQKALPPIGLPLTGIDRPLVFLLLGLWIVGFAGIVAFSGGLPVFWYVMGVPKTYVDYGIPTFSGAWNTLRVVIAILSVFLAVGRSKLDAIAIAIALFLTATVVLEANRGGLVLFALNLLAATVLAAPHIKRQIASAIFVVLITAACVVFIGNIRSADPKAVAAVDGAFATGEVVDLPHGTPMARPLSWAYLYLTTPLANLDNSATLDLARPPFPGFYTLYPLVPSVVRPPLPEGTRYALPLLSAGYTMTTAYGTAVADFGFVGASILLGVQLALSTVVFLLARQHLWAAVAAPMFFATAVLSFFTNYFFTLLMPFHVALAVALTLLLSSRVAAEGAPGGLNSSNQRRLAD